MEVIIKQKKKLLKNEIINYIYIDPLDQKVKISVDWQYWTKLKNVFLEMLHVYGFFLGGNVNQRDDLNCQNAKLNNFSFFSTFYGFWYLQWFAFTWNTCNSFIKKNGKELLLWCYSKISFVVFHFVLLLWAFIFGLKNLICSFLLHVFICSTSKWRGRWEVNSPSPFL